MGNLVVTEFITLDGVIEDPGGAESFEHSGWTGWSASGPEEMQFKFQELLTSDAQLLGRVTYDGFAAAWPTMEGTGEFGEKMNTMPKFVVSATLKDPAWNNTTVLNGDLRAEVGKLKERFEGDILVAGSARLAQSLLALDLVDELHLSLHPLVLGKGKRLFADAEESRAFTLVESQASGAVLLLSYRRRRDSMH